MYLYIKNILEYAQIAQSGPKSIVLDFEGHSNNNKKPTFFWDLEHPK